MHSLSLHVSLIVTLNYLMMYFQSDKLLNTFDNFILQFWRKTQIAQVWKYTRMYKHVFKNNKLSY